MNQFHQVTNVEPKQLKTPEAYGNFFNVARDKSVGYAHFEVVGYPRAFSGYSPRMLDAIAGIDHNLTTAMVEMEKWDGAEFVGFSENDEEFARQVEAYELAHLSDKPRSTVAEELQG